MNLDQASQPTERVGIGKRVSDLWNTRNRIAKLIILATTGMVLNCCCVIIPLSSKANSNSHAAQSNLGVNAISTPAFTITQDPFMRAALGISANTEFDSNGGKFICKNFSSQAIAQEVQGTAHIQLDASDRNRRTCKLLP